MNFFTKLRLRIKEIGKEVLVIAIIVVIALFAANFISKLFSANFTPKKKLIHKN